MLILSEVLLLLLQTPCLSTADGQLVQSTAAIARYGKHSMFLVQYVSKINSGVL